MNDSTPFDTIGDEPLEARIVAWVLGEASAFEAAELERLCEERPELLVFRRRMRALHGLLTEAEAAEPDDSWKLPPEKRKALDELFGEETSANPERDKETQIRRSGRRALLAIAACVMLAVVVLQLVHPIWITKKVYPPEMRVDFLPGGGGIGGGWAGGVGKDESENNNAENLKGGIDIVRGAKINSLSHGSKGRKDEVDSSEAAIDKQLPNSENEDYKGANTYRSPIAEAAPESPVVSPPAAPASQLSQPTAQNREIAQKPSEPARRELQDGAVAGEKLATDDVPSSRDSGLAASSSRFYDGKPGAEKVDATDRIMLERNRPAPARPTSMSEVKRELADLDTDSRTHDLDAKVPANGTTVDGIPADSGQLAFGGVTNGQRSGEATINRNNIDAVLNNPNNAFNERSDSTAASANGPAPAQHAMQLGVEISQKSKSAIGTGTGNGTGTGTGTGSGVGAGMAFGDREAAEYSGATSVAAGTLAFELKPESGKKQRQLSDGLDTNGGTLEAEGAAATPTKEDLFDERSAKLRKQLEDPLMAESKKQTLFKEWKVAKNELQEIAKIKANDKEEAGKDQVMDEKALSEPNGESAVDAKKTGGVEYEIHTGFTSQYLFRGVDLSKEAKAALAKKSPLESMEEIAASEEAYSTFSLNINDASFHIAKAALDKGERPDPEAIKVEQFYNAVDYGDPAPASNEPVAARIEQAAHPVIPGRNLVRVSLKTAAAGRGASQPLRLTLLVDQSGSMVREDRRTAMSNALKQLGGLLTPNDHITVVGFSRESHLLADNWTGDKAGKLGDLVNQTASEGGTNLEQAINLGEQMAARPHAAGEQNRIVLFTDGAANLGNANPERLAERVKSLRQKGIAFDIAGIGADGVNDRLLSELARNGNGRYYVVGDSKNESFARQLAGAFRPAAENVKVQVNFNPDRVGGYKLIGFEKDRLKTEDFRNDAVDAAELAAEEAGVAIYQVETLPQGSGEIGEVSVRFRDTSKGEMVERKWTMPFESTTQAFDRATPSMQLAGLSMLAAEKLKGGPLADAIDFRQLSGSQSLVKQFYGSSPRVADMLHVIDLLK